MKKLDKNDYIIRSQEVAELMRSRIIGSVLYNEREKRVEVITNIHTIQKIENVGTWLSPNHVIRTVLHGIEVKICEDGAIKQQVLIPEVPNKFIEVILPERIANYKKIIKDHKALVL